MGGLTRRRAMALAGAAALAAGAARAQDAEIRETITRQFEAFAAEDVEGAFGYASPGIQGMFGSAENFGRMVREGYPMVWRPGSYAFSGLEDEGGRLRQTVVITDRSGAAWVADYWMVQVDGRWRIDGVSLRPQQAVGA